MKRYERQNAAQRIRSVRANEGGPRAQRNDFRNPQPLTFVPSLWPCAVYIGWTEYEQTAYEESEPSSAHCETARQNEYVQDTQDQKTPELRSAPWIRQSAEAASGAEGRGVGASGLCACELSTAKTSTAPCPGRTGPADKPGWPEVRKVGWRNDKYPSLGKCNLLYWYWYKGWVLRVRNQRDSSFVTTSGPGWVDTA